MTIQEAACSACAALASRSASPAIALAEAGAIKLIVSAATFAGPTSPASASSFSSSSALTSPPRASSSSTSAAAFASSNNSGLNAAGLVSATAASDALSLIKSACSALGEIASQSEDLALSVEGLGAFPLLVKVRWVL